MLQVRSLRRSFGELKALDDVSFDVAAGRMTGFIGANGSGKTTTMRIILGVLSSHGGSVRWNGDPVDSTVRQRFGYMPEERGLYPKVKVAEQIAFFGRLHGLDQPAAQRNTAALLEQLELTERADDPVEQLSLGNQQRVQVAVALVHDPELLILDEPFSGLDPLAIETVLGVLRDRARQGVPVLFSSHQLTVVERLCDDLVIISGGRLAAAGTREELQRRYGPPRFAMVVADDAGWVRDLPGVSLVELDRERVVFDLLPVDRVNGAGPNGGAVSGGAASGGAASGGAVSDGGVGGGAANGGGPEQAVLREALRRGPVLSFTPVQPSLAEIFQEVI